MNAVTLAEPRLTNPLMPTDMRGAMDLAHMMATAKLVPAHLQGKPGDCLLVIEQSMRWGMSPFAVAQATSVIGGKLMFEGKLVSAALNAHGILSGRMTYDFHGEGASRAVTASATIRGETVPRTIHCTLAEAKTTNGMWVKQPDQQLVYYATRAWARRHAPEVMLGVYSPEEFDAPPDTVRGHTAEGAARPLAIRLPHTVTYHRDEDVHEAVPIAPKRQTVSAWLDALRLRVAQCQTADELDHIATSDEIAKAQKHLKNGALDDLNAIMADAMARLVAPVADTIEPAEDDTFPGDRPL